MPGWPLALHLCPCHPSTALQLFQKIRSHSRRHQQLTSMGENFEVIWNCIFFCGKWTSWLKCSFELFTKNIIISIVMRCGTVHFGRSMYFAFCILYIFIHWWFLQNSPSTSISSSESALWARFLCLYLYFVLIFSIFVYICEHAFCICICIVYYFTHHQLPSHPRSPRFELVFPKTEASFFLQEPVSALPRCTWEYFNDLVLSCILEEPAFALPRCTGISW